MRSKDTQAQYERALQLLEKQLELSHQREARFSEQISDLKTSFARYIRELQDTIVERQQVTTKVIDDFHTDMLAQFRATSQQAAIPTRDIPTVEEMLEDAKNNPTTRKAIEATLQALEFEDPLVGFN